MLIQCSYLIYRSILWTFLKFCNRLILSVYLSVTLEKVSNVDIWIITRCLKDIFSSFGDGFLTPKQENSSYKHIFNCATMFMTCMFVRSQCFGLLSKALFYASEIDGWYCEHLLSYQLMPFLTLSHKHV